MSQLNPLRSGIARERFVQASGGFGEFHEWGPRATLHRALTITDAGLALGRGTVLARMSPDAPSQRAIAAEEERILALLSVAFAKCVPVETVGYMVRASEQWSRGDKCLAHIHLASRVCHRPMRGLPRAWRSLMKRSPRVFVGYPSLYCCMWTKDFGEDICDYFPIYLKEVDESKLAPDEWITLARKGGTSDLERKLQWLFDTPSLPLTEVVESFTDWPPKPDSKETSF